MSGFFAAGRYWDISSEESSAIAKATETLAAAGIPNALKEARQLWTAVCGPGNDAAQHDSYHALVTRRAAREPLSHLVGYRDFYNHRFLVSADVLDPRPDTEALIIAALQVPFTSVLDLGTGSGCILLSLLAANANATGLGTDISPAALEIAQRNRGLLERDTQAEFIQSDWFAAVNGRFDLIVSNPPYIAADEMDALQPEVRLHEPRMALTDEGDGLSAYRIITADAPAHLEPGGRLMVEIGPTQGQAVARMMQDAGLTRIHILPDLDGRDRVVSGQMPR